MINPSNQRIIAFKMKLLPGMKEEYRRRHDAIWPELKRLLIDSGIESYHIFLDEATNTLFACQTVKGNQGSQDLGSNEIVRRWWDYMKDIMETNPDNSPVSIPLEEVFRL